MARLRIVQVADVGGVAPALRDALGDRVDMTLMPMAQPGARWPQWLKPLSIVARYLEAERIASQVRDDLPPFDIAHYHWGPNGLAAIATGGRGDQPPWILHLHGTDIRQPNRVTRMLVNRAPQVVYSTPDLAPLIDRDATYLPAPVPSLPLIDVEPRWDVLLSARADHTKGADTTFAVARRIGGSIAAMDGPRWQDGPWERLTPVPKAEWHARLRASRVVVGQFRAGTLGIADLETMMLGRPLVTWIEPKWYGDDPPPVTIAREPDEVAAAVRSLLLDPPDPAAAREWVMRHHAPALVADRLMAVYGAALMPKE